MDECKPLVTGRGKTSCVAGEPAKFSLESANPGGGRITRGKAVQVDPIKTRVESAFGFSA